MSILYILYNLQSKLLKTTLITMIYRISFLQVRPYFIILLEHTVSLYSNWKQLLLNQISPYSKPHVSYGLKELNFTSVLVL